MHGTQLTWSALRSARDSSGWKKPGGSWVTRPLLFSAAAWAMGPAAGAVLRPGVSVGSRRGWVRCEREVRARAREVEVLKAHVSKSGLKQAWHASSSAPPAPALASRQAAKDWGRSTKHCPHQWAGTAAVRWHAGSRRWRLRPGGLRPGQPAGAAGGGGMSEAGQE